MRFHNELTNSSTEWVYEYIGSESDIEDIVGALRNKHSIYSNGGHLFYAKVGEVTEKYQQKEIYAVVLGLDDFGDRIFSDNCQKTNAYHTRTTLRKEVEETFQSPGSFVVTPIEEAAVDMLQYQKNMFLPVSLFSLVIGAGITALNILSSDDIFDAAYPIILLGVVTPVGFLYTVNKIGTTPSNTIIIDENLSDEVPVDRNIFNLFKKEYPRIDYLARKPSKKEVLSSLANDAKNKIPEFYKNILKTS
ncbi:MAG: hypothetical protein KAI53_00770 [Candidatus Aenigmarchaeota archaeon]|nr:hypothetical protein [Candidatus Aenigmarchaeota archaeon]